MIRQYISTRPVRAEQYRDGMTEILGRRVFVNKGRASIWPYTDKCRIKDGQWAVETFDPLADQQVMDEAEFWARYRVFFPGEVRWRTIQPESEGASA